MINDGGARQVHVFRDGEILVVWFARRSLGVRLITSDLLGDAVRKGQNLNRFDVTGYQTLAVDFG
jgi:hypothetical protein